MLSDGGQLTDIGSWYLGGAATGVLPTDTTSSSSAAVTTRSSAPVLATVVALGCVMFFGYGP